MAGLLLIVGGAAGLLLSDGGLRALVGIERMAGLPPALSPAHGAYLGSGSFPFGLFILLVVIGFVMAAAALVVPGERFAAWHLRPVISILAAVLFFAATLRPLGLAVAGPVAITLASLATPDWRWHEVVSSAVTTTSLMIVVFVWLLRLPVPIAPWLGW
jgi:putative tricarboxylic transport membrane protein